MSLIFEKITSQEASNFLLPRHYSGRKPQISWAFGLIDNGGIVAVCTFGKPASNSLCKGVCGEAFSDNVYELNRLCRNEKVTYPMSKFISKCLKHLKKHNLIIVSYSDTKMSHHGYIYQASNFIYTGATKERTDKYTEGNKHSRHYDKEQIETHRKKRSSKHRYIFFCGDKKFVKTVKPLLRYKVMDYPKGGNRNYKLGDVTLDEVICIKDIGSKEREE